MDKSLVQNNFTLPLLSWFDKHGRKDLPWQHPRTPYSVWVSEIMLQQTQVQTVIPYFNKFMLTFPDIYSLAKAHEDQVLALWAGLGYYSRARNLHQCAKNILDQFQGQIPSCLELLQKLPGIGRSTAAAIGSQAFNTVTPILDANVKRVLSRYFMIDGLPQKKEVENKLWQLAEICMSFERPCDYTQSIMDLGATCCKSKNPSCTICPVNNSCLAFTHEKVSTYPYKKIKKALPSMEKQFLLFYTANKKIYLEKRPPTGIWGGLWCLPSIDIDQCPKTFADSHDYRFLELQKIKDIKHTFSHFHLYMQSFAIKVEAKGTMVKEEKGKWFSIEEIGALGLAKPISDILNTYVQEMGILSAP